MQDANTYVNAGEHAQILNAQEATGALGHILSNGMASFHRRAYRLLGNAADAEDAVQDALLAAYTHLDQFKGQAQLSTWLSAIVQNCARMQLRKRLRHIHVPLDEPIAEGQEHAVWERLADNRPSPEDECRDSELSRCLARFQNQLSPTQLRAFRLREIQGLSIRETAQILGVPQGTVKAQSARARKKLKELMQRALRPRSRSLRASVQNAS